MGHHDLDAYLRKAQLERAAVGLYWCSCGVHCGGGVGAVASMAWGAAESSHRVVTSTAWPVESSERAPVARERGLAERSDNTVAATGEIARRRPESSERATAQA